MCAKLQSVSSMCEEALAFTPAVFRKPTDTGKMAVRHLLRALITRMMHFSRLEFWFLRSAPSNLEHCRIPMYCGRGCACSSVPSWLLTNWEADQLRAEGPGTGVQYELLRKLEFSSIFCFGFIFYLEQDNMTLIIHTSLGTCPSVGCPKHQLPR